MDYKFRVIDEYNVEREATLITTFMVDDKKYAMYSIDRDTVNVNIFVSELIKDENGNDTLRDITDTLEKEKVANIVKNIIKLPL